MERLDACAQRPIDGLKFWVLVQQLVVCIEHGVIVANGGAGLILSGGSCDSLFHYAHRNGLKQVPRKRGALTEFLCNGETMVCKIGREYSR
jgi:hypothetical protein